MGIDILTMDNQTMASREIPELNGGLQLGKSSNDIIGDVYYIAMFDYRSVDDKKFIEWVENG